MINLLFCFQNMKYHLKEPQLLQEAILLDLRWNPTGKITYHQQSVKHKQPSFLLRVAMIVSAHVEDYNESF